MKLDLSSRLSLGCATVVVATLALLASPRMTEAELVLMVTGHFLKVGDYRVEGDRIHLTLESGGTLEVPLLQVERIVEDEVVPAPEEAPEDGIPIHFRPTHRTPDTPYGELIFELSRRFELNPGLVAAVVRAESAFDPEAVSRKGALGLMQLMPATARRFGVSGVEVLDPRANVEAGVRYLQWLGERFTDDLPRVLAAYNAGEATVDRYDGVPPYRETHDFIRRVFDFYRDSEPGTPDAPSEP